MKNTYKDLSDYSFKISLNFYSAVCVLITLYISMIVVSSKFIKDFELLMSLWVIILIAVVSMLLFNPRKIFFWFFDSKSDLNFNDYDQHKLEKLKRISSFKAIFGCIVIFSTLVCCFVLFLLKNLQ